MKSIELTEANATLMLDGSETTRSMDIKNVVVNKWPEEGGNIKLIVLDEKDVPIYRQVLAPSQSGTDGAIEVNKRFAFYDHLSVQFLAEREEGAFRLTLNFE